MVSDHMVKCKINIDACQRWSGILAIHAMK